MRFKKIYIEITNTCNLSCSFCIKNSRKSQFITCEQFEYVLNQIKPYTKYIYLHILGEPLLHPQLSQLLEIAYKNEIYVNITTNATLLPKNLPILLSSPAVRQINLSIHSFPECPQYLENTIECADQLSKKGIYVSYRLWTLDTSLPDSLQETLITLESHYNIKINHYKDSIKLADHCFVSFDSTFTWPELTHPYIGVTGTCQGFRHMCGILVDGSVVPCCLDSKGDATLGNIYTTSFSQILDNHKKLLEDFQNHKMTLELCQKCQYRLRFDSK